MKITYEVKLKRGPVTTVEGGIRLDNVVEQYFDEIESIVVLPFKEEKQP